MYSWISLSGNWHILDGQWFQGLESTVFHCWCCLFLSLPPWFLVQGISIHQWTLVQQNHLWISLFHIPLMIVLHISSCWINLFYKVHPTHTVSYFPNQETWLVMLKGHLYNQSQVHILFCNSLHHQVWMPVLSNSHIQDHQRFPIHQDLQLHIFLDCSFSSFQTPASLLCPTIHCINNWLSVQVCQGQDCQRIVSSSNDVHSKGWMSVLSASIVHQYIHPWLIHPTYQNQLQTWFHTLLQSTSNTDNLYQLQ